MSDPLHWINAESERWSRLGLSRQLVPRAPARPGRIVQGGRELINFGSNDYLGLACDPRLREAAVNAAERFGWGAGASPLVTGWTDAHAELAEALARFEQVEAVALFASGFAANLGTMAALVARGDVVYADRLAHGSLIDGARLSGARLRVFPHNDVNRLASIITRDQGRFRRSLIVTEGLFSMDGDMAPLADLVDVADRFSAMLLVDEAHATGVLGPDGRGAASTMGVAERIPIRVGTLSKALGSVGGFVAGSRALIDWLVNHARTMIYSTALPSPAAAAAREALDIVESEPLRREYLLSLSSRLRGALGSAGVAVDAGASPIIPIVFGETDRARAAADLLSEKGFFVPAIRPPTVAAGTARLRLSLSVAHETTDVDAILAALCAL
jgi:8-amino-7-oxononanoate synthase